MRRRQLLTATAGLVGFAGTASGRRQHPSPARHASPSSAALQDSADEGLDPLGLTSVPDIKEAVVGAGDATVYAAVTDGLATIDVSDPANPSVLAERRGLLADHPEGPMQQVNDVKRDGNRVVVVGPANPRRNVVNAAVFYDVTDPAAPERLAVHETDFPIHNCDFENGVAYLTGNGFQTNELVTVEFDGTTARELGRWSLTDVDPEWGTVFRGLWTLHDVTVSGDRAYLAHWDAGTWIVDVSDPATPSLVARVRGAPVEDLADMGQREARQESFSRPGNDHYVDVTGDGSVLAVGVEAWNATETGPGPGGITLYDVSTADEPEELSFIEPPETPDATYQGTWTTSHNFDIDGDRLYTSWYQGGVRVFDIADPANPVELAAFRDESETSFWTAQSAGDFFVASSGEKAGAELPSRLYTFPDPEGGASGSSSAMPDSAGEETLTTTASGNGTDAGGESEAGATAANNTTGTTAGSGPGFGVLGSLAALGLGAWHARRRGDRDTDSG